MKIKYVERKFSPGSLEIIRQADAICTAYARQGFTLTLRQLYYQFVAKALIPNKDTEYKRLGGIINDARLAGLIDWAHLEDRTRNLRSLGHWAGPGGILSAAAQTYQDDLWANQETHLEVWIEKDALVGVIEGVCQRNDVGYFSCRGYTSQTEVWGAARRLLRAYQGGAKSRLVVLHLGDHDPSGIDMSRDIEDRLRLFLGHDDPGAERALDVQRLALNFDQVEEYGPPPNPAKLTDSRIEGYLERFGPESWELDALPPPAIDALIQGAIRAERDAGLWDEAIAERDADRATLTALSDRWDEVKAQFAPNGPAE